MGVSTDGIDLHDLLVARVRRYRTFVRIPFLLRLAQAVEPSNFLLMIIIFLHHFFHLFLLGDLGEEKGISECLHGLDLRLGLLVRLLIQACV